MGGFANNAPIVTDGLVFYVDAGNSKSYPGSGTTLSDLVGESTGSMVNMNNTNYSSVNGGLFQFDGVNERFDLSTNIFNGLSNSGITFGAWFNIDSVSGIHTITGAWTNTIANDQVTLALLSNSTIVFAVADGSTGESGVASSTALSTNIWYYVVGTWNINRTINIYINGLFNTTGTQTGNGYNSSSTATFRIGAQVTGQSRYFNGKVAQVQTYNRVLSDAEILQNYNALKNRFV